MEYQSDNLLQPPAVILPFLSSPCDFSSQALEALNKKDITEIKSYGKPPLLVEKVMEAVMILRGTEPSWAESKRQLGKNK